MAFIHMHHYGMCNCGPGMHWGMREWTKEDKIKALDRYEKALQEELKEIKEARESLQAKA